MSVLEQNSRRKLLLGQDGNSLTMLLILNAILFVIINSVKIIYLISGDTEVSFITGVLSWFTVPANPQMFVTRPWTLISYMFTHYSVWHLISNVLWLWCFGYILQDISGNKKIIPVYLYGGFIGALFFLLVVNAIPALRAVVDGTPPLIGAGPAAMAIAVATTALAPGYKIFPMIRGGIPLWVLTAAFVLINIVSIGTGNPALLAAQVAGGLTGYAFVWQLQKGNDWSEWMINLVNWMDDLFNPEKKYKKKTEAPRVFYKTQRQPFQKKPHVTQQRIDELLDKINQKGYHFLTDEEKEFLKKASTEEF